MNKRKFNSVLTGLTLVLLIFTPLLLVLPHEPRKTEFILKISGGTFANTLLQKTKALVFWDIIRHNSKNKIFLEHEFDVIREEIIITTADVLNTYMTTHNTSQMYSLKLYIQMQQNSKSLSLFKDYRVQDPQTPFDLLEQTYETEMRKLLEKHLIQGISIDQLNNPDNIIPLINNNDQHDNLCVTLHIKFLCKQKEIPS